MPKIFRITSEVINFSLVMPDHTTIDEASREAKQMIGQSLGAGWKATVHRVKEHEEEEEEAEALLGRLCADYYRSNP